MTPDISEALGRLAEEIFEQLAFLFPEPCDTAPNDYTRDVLAVSVNFHGPFSGQLIGVIGTAVLPELVSNMLGLDESEQPTEQHGRDAFKELLNVLCGNLLPEVAGEKPVFDLDAPEELAPDVLLQAIADPAVKARVFMTIDGEKIEFLLLHEDWTLEGKGTED